MPRGGARGGGPAGLVDFGEAEAASQRSGFDVLSVEAICAMRQCRREAVAHTDLLENAAPAGPVDVEEGITAALRWVARELPVYSLNFVLASATDLWALRYPESHGLLMLERGVGGPGGGPWP